MDRTPINLLRNGWNQNLVRLAQQTEKTLVVCSPYITKEGVKLVTDNVTESFRRNGSLLVITDLSPINVMQGSTDPEALRCFSGVITRYEVKHLPRLHAKVYVSDNRQAVITSGNLTSGGLRWNYEYGVEVFDRPLVEIVHRDITSYADLGAIVSPSQLESYCEAAKDVREAFRNQQSSARRSLRLEFERKVRSAEDELIRMRLAGGAVHTVFGKTILYLLARHGPLATSNLHSLIESIHPDLCDNSVDRVIDGKSFGKKWKHAVRTAQQKLKQQGMIKLSDARWFLRTTQ